MTISRHDCSANRGHSRGRGGNLAIVAPPPPNVAAAADSQAEYRRRLHPLILVMLNGQMLN